MVTSWLDIILAKATEVSPIRDQGGEIVSRKSQNHFASCTNKVNPFWTKKELSGNLRAPTVECAIACRWILKGFLMKLKNRK